MTLLVSAGNVFEADGQVYIVASLKNSTTAVVRNLISKEIVEFATSEIKALLPAVGGQSPPLENLLFDTAGAQLEKPELIEMRRIAIALKPLLGKSKRTTAEVREVAEQLGSSLPSVYRWLAAVEKTGRLSALLRQKRRDIGKKMVSPAVEAAMSETIKRHWVSKLKKSKAAVYEELIKYCAKKQLTPPDISTLNSRIKALPGYETKKSREGEVAALPYRLGKGSITGADYPYAMIQIDHTKVDIELVDSMDRKPIGRPWITIAIDVYSRMVVGWYISFDPPGALATGITIANLILPKGPQMALMGVDFEWLCQGVPGVIHSDNAKEFRGKMLELACEDLRISARFRKLKKPQFGAHIERLQGSLMAWIHEIEGTTFSNTKEKGDYKSADNAIMALDEFEEWFANLVLGKYHFRPHGGLGERAPVDVYRDAILGSDELPGIGMSPTPSDERRLRLDLLPVIERTIQAGGVEISTIHYRHPVLGKWVGARDPKHPKLSRKFIFRRDPRDISKVYFLDPDLNIYFEIPYADPSRKPMSLWRLNAVKAWLKAKGATEADINEDIIFKALADMDAIVANAKKKTSAKRREEERAKKHSAGNTKKNAATKSESKVAPPAAETAGEDDDNNFSFGTDIKPLDEVSF